MNKGTRNDKDYQVRQLSKVCCNEKEDKLLSYLFFCASGDVFKHAHLSGYRNLRQCLPTGPRLPLTLPEITIVMTLVTTIKFEVLGVILRTTAIDDLNTLDREMVCKARNSGQTRQLTNISIHNAVLG